MGLVIVVVNQKECHQSRQNPMRCAGNVERAMTRPMVEAIRGTALVERHRVAVYGLVSAKDCHVGYHFGRSRQHAMPTGDA